MGAEKLAKSLGIDKCEAQNYITLHKRVYAQYHRLSNVAMHKAFDGGLATVLEWQIKLGDKGKERTAMNFLIQGTGGDILRAACIALHNQGATLIGTVHDAVIFECDDDENLDAEVKRLEGIMQDASKDVLGSAINTESLVVHGGDQWEVDFTEEAKQLIQDLVKC